jgi:deoxyribodipyrimidine photo-lyase
MATLSHVPATRLRALNPHPARPAEAFVVYWMAAARRLHWNFALDHAVELARRFERPLVIFEALRCDYPWASDRMHAFVLQGMAEHARALSGRERDGILYYPYVEPSPGAGKGLLAQLATAACAVVTDDFPAFTIPHTVRAAAAQTEVSLVAVDGNGLLPMRAASRVFPTAYAFRRYLQLTLPEHLSASPRRDPLSRLALAGRAVVPEAVRRRWPATPARLLDAAGAQLARLPIDHAVAPAPTPGGTAPGRRALRRFVQAALAGYAEDRNALDQPATSGLSPYLHFGQLSAHEIFRAVADAQAWSVDRLSPRADGKRAGWWGMSPGAESFLDQLVTWRELGFNLCWQRDDYDRWDSLPTWARRTLEQHARDPRPFLYTQEELDAGCTHDPLWNAAQGELRREGRIHNYLRMLWGKKILEWTRSPQEALSTLIELNNRYALDGRDPNSYSGIFWCLGRYDRPWAPERPIFGSIRYMSSRNTARKLDVAAYIRRHAVAGG